MKIKTHKAKLTAKAKLSADKHTMQLVSEPAEIKCELDENGKPKGPATFSGVGYSGGMVPGHTATPRLPHPYVIDLAATAMSYSRNHLANLEHKPNQRVGHLTNVHNDGKRLAVEGIFSAATAHRDEVVNSHLSGHPWEFSIEGNLAGAVFVERGKSVAVNGQTFTGPFFRMTKNKFTDVAFVGHGADDGNEVKIAASTAGEIEMTEFEKWMVSCGVDLESVSDEHRARLQAAYDATQSKPEKKPARSFSELAAAERSEHKRRDDIHRMGLEACREAPMFIDQIENAVADAIESKMSQTDFELALLRSIRTRVGTFATQSHRDINDEVFEAALAMQTSLPNIEKHYSEQTLSAVDKHGLRSFGLQELLIRIACQNGYVARPAERIGVGNIRTVLEYCFPPATARLAASFSTINLPGILGNIANKELLAGYMEEDQTWREISSIKSVNNFFQHTSYRMLDNLEYELLPPGGMISHGTLDQESYTRQVKTYARMISLERTQIINDDLGAFDDLRTRIGRGAAKKFNNIFWAAFINNSSFFTTARTNYLEGATTNLGGDGVGLGLTLTKYRKMTSPAADGLKRVGQSMSRPTIILVPPELEIIARQLNVSANFVTGANATIPGSNVFVNLFRPVVQSRLSDSAFTGNSATAFYLFGDDLKPMVVSFLNGRQTPTVESADADFNVLGIQFRGYHDFGSDQAEYLSGTKSKGAA